MCLAFFLLYLKRALAYISETPLINPKLVATYLSSSQSDVSYNTADMEIIKNNNSMVKVIEVEDQSMRSIGTKIIDIATLDAVTSQSCDDHNRCPNNDTFATKSSTTATFNVLNTAVGK